MKTLTGTLVVLVGLALAGCSGSSSDGKAPSTLAAVPSEIAPSASPTVSASPTPQAQTHTQTAAPITAQGDPCTDPSVSLVGLPGLDYDRYANICLGMSFAQASGAMQGPAINGDAACPWYATLLDFGDPGLHVGAVTNPDNPGASIYMFRMTWQSDQQSAVDFDAPATPAGISVGSTTAEVKAAYPKAAAVVVNDPARGQRNQLVVAQPAGSAFAFDVTDGFVTDIYWGNGVSQGAGGELCAL